MKVKKGDKVIVIAGKDKGTVGEIIAVSPRLNRVVVEGVNIHRHAEKPNNINPDGGLVNKEMPIDASNVMLYDNKAKKGSRVGYKEEKGKKVRYYKKSKQTVKEAKK
ncbi:MAG: 50S ribosomal protein L24 [Erysipelotrichaceae bacterium]|nr:50S ribosomal protein L24 [Erysipelotrichaceae bacterium]